MSAAACQAAVCIVLAGPSADSATLEQICYAGREIGCVSEHYRRAIDIVAVLAVEIVENAPFVGDVDTVPVVKIASESASEIQVIL